MAIGGGGDDDAWEREVDEAIAREFHEAYERLAPSHGYETRQESAVPWDDVPERNRNLMAAVVRELRDRGVI